MVRRTLTTATLLLLLSTCALGQVIAFENVNVIPMDRERVIERQTVIIRDGRIAEIGPVAKIAIPDGSTRIAGAGKYLIPGLAEMHGHLPSPDSPRALVE